MNVQNLIKKIKMYSFLKNNKGSVSIEFILILVVLLFLLVFMADLAILRSNMGKLDNLSYSLVNLVRERTQFYPKEKEVTHNGKTFTIKVPDEKIKEGDLPLLESLAKGMFFGDPQSKKELYLVVKSINFDQTSPLTSPTSTITTIKSHNSNKCIPTTKLEDIENIAPRSELNNERTLPLYQVTVCIPTYSIFKSITAGDAEAQGLLRSSSVTVGR